LDYQRTVHYLSATLDVVVDVGVSVEVVVALGEVARIVVVIVTTRSSKSVDCT